jgi:glycosyltransferase involved in cell wall biosynthesis
VKNVLFVGEHPRGVTGNSAMMAAILEQLDTTKYKPVVFTDYTPQNRISIFSDSTPCDVIIARETEQDLGCGNLINLVRLNEDIDAIILVGVDIWRFALAMEHIYQLSAKRKFKTAGIIPYDLPTYRKDYAMWFTAFDFPCVYSRFGYSVLEPHVPGLQYFRPPLYKSELFVPFDGERKQEARQKYFSQMGKDRFIFGFVGANQFRKDPQRAIKAFFETKKKHPNITLYLHTNMTAGVFNLEQISQDYASHYGAKIGDVISKRPSHYYDREAMIEIYNALDCVVNTSAHEGLSWTIIESMLCGTPVVAADNTAQMELLEGGAGYGVRCTETGFIPVVTGSGRSFIETKLCDPDDLVEGMSKVVKYEDYRKKLKEKGLNRGREWVEKSSNINTLLSQMLAPDRIQVTGDRKEAVLFVQHSSAGDVLMSTQCFKGIKERHEGLPLVYMTQEVYKDIVEGNPYIDEIVTYDQEEANRYNVIYNPHAERILPGGFNNLDTRLHDMYPYFCEVEADDIYIKEEEVPSLTLPDNYIVVQTAGGEKKYRTYRHMDMIVQMFPEFKFIQLGSGLDMACMKAHLDLREKLTWRQSAWVM